VACRRSWSFDISVLRGNGDGTFKRTVGFGVGVQPLSVVISDLNGDNKADLVTANFASNDLSILLNAGGTISANLSCSPSSGTLPFVTHMSVTLENHYPGQTRRMAARINIDLANGTSVTSWRRGYANIAAGSNYTTNWNQNLPLTLSLVGNNVFSLEAEDVTPAPFNQPPYPPSGDTDVDGDNVTGIKP
jgi:hypothetical protein